MDLTPNPTPKDPNRPEPLPCRTCGSGNEAHTGLEAGTPKDGDISICFYCGTMSVFRFGGETYTLEPPGPALEAELAADPYIREVIDTIKTFPRRHDQN